VLIALCCHQVCQLQHYCNPTFFLEELGFDTAAFKQITQMSSWAVSGSRATVADSDSESYDSDHIDGGEHVPPTVDAVDDTNTVGAAAAQLHANIPAGANSVAARTGLSKQGQEEVGRLCKRLLDTGRIKYLEANGFSARLQVYIDRALSLENVVLVATPKPPL
jgi:tRNA:m4X modification enzyme